MISIFLIIEIAQKRLLKWSFRCICFLVGNLKCQSEIWGLVLFQQLQTGLLTWYTAYSLWPIFFWAEIKCSFWINNTSNADALLKRLFGLGWGFVSKNRSPRCPWSLSQHCQLPDFFIRKAGSFKAQNLTQTLLSLSNPPDTFFPLSSDPSRCRSYAISLPHRIPQGILHPRPTLSAP